VTRYLVTGGAGFIGSHLVEHLVAQAGSEVRVLDNFATGKRENLAPWLDRIELVEGSVVDLELCRRACDGVRFVLHQAAVPSVPRSVAEPMVTHEANVTGTLTMLLAARDAGVRRFVYASSSSVYGDGATLPKEESARPSPLSPYAVAKLAGEQYCRVFTSVFGLDTISLRYFNVFGPRQDPESPYAAAVPKFIAAALDGESPVIFGDGSQTRDFTYVADVVHANMLACRAPKEAAGAVVNVAGGAGISVNDVWDVIRTRLGATVAARRLPPRAGEVRHSVASLERARTVLGYEPAVGSREGLRLTCEWHLAHRKQAV